MDETPQQKERNLFLRFKEQFDDIYVSIKRYSLVEKMIFSLTATVVLGVISIGVAYVLKSI